MVLRGVPTGELECLNGCAKNYDTTVEGCEPRCPHCLHHTPPDIVVDNGSTSIRCGICNRSYRLEATRIVRYRTWKAEGEHEQENRDD